MNDYSERIEVRNDEMCAGISIVYTSSSTNLFSQDYEIIQVLGKGGFATVYKARCLSRNQDVAIKMVNLIKRLPVDRVPQPINHFFRSTRNSCRHIR